ncbi:tyrosine-type recombinase/integrase [Cupriavidus basilensis]
MPKRVEPLSDTKLRNAKPREKPYKLADGGGLFLEVVADGRKLWRIRPLFSAARQREPAGLRRLSRGAAGAGTARCRPALLATGRDPGAAKVEQRRAVKIAAGNSLEAIARDWYATQKSNWVEYYAGRVIASLENDVFPVIGAMPIADIKAPVRLDMLRKIEARGVWDTTKRILQRVRAAFQYGIIYGACDRNPAADIDSAAALKGAPVVHQARVSALELP